VANTRSSRKRIRQNARRGRINAPRRTAAKTYVAKAIRVASGGASGESAAALTEAISALDRAAKTGAIHRNAAARRKSRLALKVNAALGGTAVETTTRVRATGKAAAAKAARARVAASKARGEAGPKTAAGKARVAMAKTTTGATKPAAGASAAAAPKSSSSKATSKAAAASKPTAGKATAAKATAGKAKTTRRSAAKT
jgi:ribosomal protein S20